MKRVVLDALQGFQEKLPSAIISYVTFACNNRPT